MCTRIIDKCKLNISRNNWYSNHNRANKQLTAATENLILHTYCENFFESNNKYASGNIKNNFVE